MSPLAMRRNTLIAASGTAGMPGRAQLSHRNPPAAALNAAALAASGFSHEVHTASCGAYPSRSRAAIMK